jgi:hypothetical protein
MRANDETLTVWMDIVNEMGYLGMHAAHKQESLPKENRQASLCHNMGKQTYQDSATAAFKTFEA